MLNAMMAHQNVHARIPNKINAPNIHHIKNRKEGDWDTLE